MTDAYLFTFENGQTKTFEADQVHNPRSNRPSYVLLKDGRRIAEIESKYVVSWEMKNSEPVSRERPENVTVM